MDRELKVFNELPPLLIAGELVRFTEVGVSNDDGMITYLCKHHMTLKELWFYYDEEKKEYGWLSNDPAYDGYTKRTTIDLSAVYKVLDVIHNINQRVLIEDKFSELNKLKDAVAVKIGFTNFKELLKSFTHSSVTLEGYIKFWTF